MFQGTGSRNEHRRRYPAGAADQRPRERLRAPLSYGSFGPARGAARPPRPGERTAGRAPGPRPGRRGEPAAARPSKGSDVTTMHDVARHADVSVATASHVLNATRPVRPAIRAGRPASRSARTRRACRPRPLPTGRPPGAHRLAPAPDP
ncbi:LacI family DNA-binding transcriptional regulator [Streptomyces buecherae]|uniref:LacI family DNA-binding transcriptional regulator n=1 Tax=Streptomyces buecherae TaxID=2763006 RepID=UPI0035561A46